MNLWFTSEELRRTCSDPTLMRRLWGPHGARCLARRLQQLHAMSSRDDLDFLPFDTRVLDDGAIEVQVTHDLVLVLVAEQDRPNDEGDAMDHLTVTEIAAVVREMGNR